MIFTVLFLKFISFNFYKHYNTGIIWKLDLYSKWNLLHFLKGVGATITPPSLFYVS